MNPQLLLLIEIATFLIYLYPQALMINGIYISAAGRSDTLPDGTSADSEMILYPLYKYLNQSTTDKMYFTFESLKSKGITNWASFTWGRVQWQEGISQLLIQNAGQVLNIDALKTWATAYLNAKVTYNAADGTVMFYQDITKYKFSKYIRGPIITCVICMASFWSIFTFLLPVIFILPKMKIFIPLADIFPIWIANVFCLAYLNFLIFKPRI